MTFNVSDFLRAALPALKFPGSNPLVPITGCVLISPIEGVADRVTITATSGYGSIRVSAPVIAAPTSPICIEAEDLTKLLKATSGEGSLKTEKLTGYYSSGTVNIEVPVQDPKTFPKTDSYADELALEMPAEELRVLLSKMTNLGEDWDAKPGLSGISFYENRAATTNAHDPFHISRATLSIPCTKPFMLAHRAVPHILAAIAGMGEETVTIAVNDQNYITVGAGDTELNIVPYAHSSYAGAAEFEPKLAADFEKKAVFEANADSLKTAIVRASIFGATWVALQIGATSVLITGTGNIQNADLPGYKTASEMVAIKGTGDVKIHLTVKPLIAVLSAMEGNITAQVGEGRVILSSDDMTYLQTTVSVAN